MISFIIPTYKEEKAIEATLKRLKDNPPDCSYEIIVSDAESPDETVLRAKPFADKIVVEPKKTIGRGRNAGAEVAQGDYFVFLDSDTEIPHTKETLNTLLSRFRDNPELLGITLPVKVYSDKLTLSMRVVLWIYNTYYGISNNWFHSGSSWGKFQMVRSDAFKKIGGYNEALPACEDYDLFFRLSRIGRTRFENSVYVIHNGRRHLQLGPWRVFFRGILEGIWYTLSGKPISKEWKAVR